MGLVPPESTANEESSGEAGKHGVFRCRQFRPDDKILQAQNS
jgi:hypothetical protein